MTYLPHAYNARRTRRTRRAGRMSYTRANALHDACAIIACVVFILGALALLPVVFGARDASAAPASQRYTLVMIYNTPVTALEVAAMHGVSFATCDAQQRAVWASPARNVTLVGGGVVPAIDAYCVADSDVRGDVVALADVLAPKHKASAAPVPFPSPMFAR